MKYIKKVIRTGGGLVVRVPSEIVKLLNLTAKDYVEVDINRLDVKKIQRQNR